MAEFNFESGFPMFECDLFGSVDLDVLTTQFNSSAEGPNSIKIEKGLKTKDLMLAERQVEVGYENEFVQFERKPSILALEESLSSRNETFQSLGNLQDKSVLQFEPRELEEIDACNRSEEIDIYPTPSEKERNPPYLIKEKDITTKNEIPVSFMIEGCQPRDKVMISMRYCDELNKDLPVNRCKMHPNGNVGKLPSELHPGFNFYLTTKCSYRNSTEDALNHPTAEIDLQDKLVEDGKFKFSIVFLCLNSCHRQNSKKLELVVEVYNYDRNLVKKECIDVRVCKNVKRDHKEKSQSFSPKRKTSSDDEPQTPQKIKKIRAKIPQDTPPSDDSGSSQEQKPSYVFQMKSNDDTTTILNLIKRLGGEYHVQTEYEIIPVQIIDEPDTFVNVSVPITSNVQPDPFVDLIAECERADIKIDA